MRRLVLAICFCAGCYDVDALSRRYDGAVAPPLDLSTVVSDLSAPSDLSQTPDLATGDASVAHWRDVQSPTTQPLRALAAADPLLYAVGASSTILQIAADGSITTESAPVGFSLRGAAAAGGSVWAVGDDGTLLTRGTTGWSYSTISDGTFYSAWALAADDLFLVGSAGTAYRGQTFEDTSTFFALFGLWGSADDSMFAVGEAGTIVQRTGDPPWVALTSGSSSDLYAVSGSVGKLVVVGAGGVILGSTDGQTWTPQASGTTVDLFGVWVESGDAFAVGDAGTILHRSDGAWSLQHSGGPALRAVLGSSSTDVWAVGDGGTILHYSF